MHLIDMELYVAVVFLAMLLLTLGQIEQLVSAIAPSHALARADGPVGAANLARVEPNEL